jgi:hypothetical protein
MFGGRQGSTNCIREATRRIIGGTMHWKALKEQKQVFDGWDISCGGEQNFNTLSAWGTVRRRTKTFEGLLVFSRSGSVSRSWICPATITASCIGLGNDFGLSWTWRPSWRQTTLASFSVVPYHRRFERFGMTRRKAWPTQAIISFETSNPPFDYRLHRWLASRLRTCKLPLV